MLRSTVVLVALVMWAPVLIDSRLVLGSFPVEPVRATVVRIWTSDALGEKSVAVTNWYGYCENGGKVPAGWYWLQTMHKGQSPRVEQRCFESYRIRVDLYLESCRS